MDDLLLSQIELSICKVRQAISDLKAGYFVTIDEKYLIASAETITELNFNRLTKLFKDQVHLICNPRAALCLKSIEHIANYLQANLPHKTLEDLRLPEERHAVALLKLAQLLPAFFIARLSKPTKKLTNITGSDIKVFKEHSSADLVKLSTAVTLNLKAAKQASFHIFRSKFDCTEYYAILIGDVNKTSDPFIRIHSSCYTGDLLNSLQCDCNAQLALAIAYMGASPDNAGILIYLPQEGRGIGLANKLRTYELQAQGHDTVEANEMLGFKADEREFKIAANILKEFQISKVRLLSNNPQKARSLEASGIQVTQILPLITEINQYNKTYLETKKQKMGHTI